MIFTSSCSSWTISSAFMSSVTKLFDTGQDVRPMPRSRTTSTRDGSSTMLVPWSMRSTPISSMTWRMFSMLPTWSMSQCIVSLRPSSRARANVSANLRGGLSRSSESRPTPTMRSRYGVAASRVCAADSALWSRRKHMMSAEEMPSSARASTVARW